MRIHLVNVSQDEAEASMQHHPSKDVCARCGDFSAALFLMRPPGQFVWGQNIGGIELCDDCETTMLEMMAAIKEEDGN